MTETEQEQQAERNPDFTRESKLVVFTLVLGTAVMLLNETTLSVALPVIMDSFHISAATAQWLTTGYMLTMAVVIPTTGFIIERFTTRQVFTAAFILFLAGTVVAALAPVFGILLAGRVLQAAGTALMMPLLMTTVMHVVPISMRGTFMGMMSVVIALAPAFGPTVAGFILNAFSWHYVFWLMIPFTVVILLVALRFISNVGQNNAKPFDNISVVLSALGFGGLVYTLSEIESLMSGNNTSVLFGIIGGFSLLLFVLRQRALSKRDAALLDLRVFTIPGFATGIIVIMVIFGLLLGMVTILPIYLQRVLLASTAVSGLVVMPGGLLQALAAPFVGQLYDKVGVRPLLIPGAIVMTLAVVTLVWATLGHPSVYVMAGLYVFFVAGVAISITPLFTALLSKLPRHLYSHGSATLSTAQQLASAMGVAILVAALTQQTNVQVAQGTQLIDATAAGTTVAFLVAVGLGVVAIVLSFFIKSSKN